MSIERLVKRASKLKTQLAVPHVIKPTPPKARFGQKPAFPLPSYVQPPIRARQTRRDKGIEGY